MKKLNIRSFFAGILTTILLFAIITTALAASGSVTYSGVNLTMDGMIIFSKEEDLELVSGEKVPSSILYVDQAGGGTTYLPVRDFAALLGISVTWDQETETVDLKRKQTVVEAEPDQFLQDLAEQWLVDGNYPKNDKGETYGPEILYEVVGCWPDLIAAAATNGQDGYLRRSEMDAYLSSTDNQHNSLPVYDLDGNVIGEFVFEDGPSISENNEKISISTPDSVYVTFCSVSDIHNWYLSQDEIDHLVVWINDLIVSPIDLEESKALNSYMYNNSSQPNYLFDIDVNDALESIAYFDYGAGYQYLYTENDDTWYHIDNDPAEPFHKF